MTGVQILLIQLKFTDLCRRTPTIQSKKSEMVLILLIVVFWKSVYHTLAIWWLKRAEAFGVLMYKQNQREQHRSDGGGACNVLCMNPSRTTQYKHSTLAAPSGHLMPVHFKPFKHGSIGYFKSIVRFIFIVAHRQHCATQTQLNLWVIYFILSENYSISH